MSEVVVFWALVGLSLGLSVCRVVGCRARGIVWIQTLVIGAAVIVWGLHLMGWYS